MANKETSVKSSKKKCKLEYIFGLPNKIVVLSNFQAHCQVMSIKIKSLLVNQLSRKLLLYSKSNGKIELERNYTYFTLNNDEYQDSFAKNLKRLGLNL